MTGESHFSEVFLDGVRIPAANLLGGEGEGWRVTQTTLNSERSSIAGGMGATPAALISFARRFDGATADPLVRQRLVDTHIRYELLRFLRYRSQTALSQGRRPGGEASVMKLAFARYMKALTEAAVDTQGAYGLLGGADVADDGMWLRRFLHSPSLRIAGGSDQVQANIMGERVLGLPPEPRTDKDVAFRDLARRRSSFRAMTEAPSAPVLTKSQAARRERVVRAALELGAEGGYDAVQMRDVATRAEVALGTIYRYFPSKDSLLLAVMVHWLGDLERRVSRRPPTGDTTVERIMDVMTRALGSMDRDPRLTAAVIGAMTAGDPASVPAIEEVSRAMARTMQSAFPPDVDPALEAATAKVLGHVWWSATISWANGMGDIDWVANELRVAAELLAERFD